MTDRHFARRALIATSIVAGMGLLILAMWQVGTVLLVIFGGLLFAIFLRAFADPLHRATQIPSRLSVALVAVAFLGLLVGVGFLVGPAFADQVSTLIDRLPASIRVVEQQLVAWGWTDAASSDGDLAAQVRTQLLERGGDAVTWVTTMVGSVAWILTAVTFMALAGLYLALQPRLYRSGVVRLVPEKRRDHAFDVVTSVGVQLRGWLFGQLASMLVVGVLTGLGLWILGVPLALALAVISFFLAFIPNLGPIAALVVAVLVTLVDSPEKVWWVVALYAAVQFLESYLITPLIQRRAADIPPALLLATQLVFGVLFGFLGVLMATPLTAAALVLVQRLYQEDVLGEPHDATPAG